MAEKVLYDARLDKRVDEMSRDELLEMVYSLYQDIQRLHAGRRERASFRRSR